MPDPNGLPPLPPGFTLDAPSAGIGRPVIRKGAPPVSPTETYHPMTPQERQSLGLGAGVPAVVSDTGKPEVIGGDKTNYRPMTVQEKTANHLSPDAPWLMGTNGDFKLPDGYKPAENANGTAEKQQALDAADSLIQGVHKARSFVNDGYDIPVVGNTATGLGYNVLRHSPLPTDASKLEGVINQEIRGNIFLKRIADLKQAAADDGSTTGGTGIGRIMQAEIPLITGAIGTLDPGKLGKQETLNSLDQIERSALRSKAIINGENPDDPAVQKKYGIPPLPAYPNGTLPGAPPPATGGGTSGGGSSGGPPPIMPSGGITPSSPLPAIMGGPGMSASSGQTKAVTDPQLAKIAPQLEKYLATDPKQVSNAMILGFLQKNGVDPSRLSQSLYPALQYRMSKEGAAWRARGGNYVVSPTYDVPMSQSEKDSNALSQSAPAAALINAGDAATAGNLDKLLPAQATDSALAVANAQHPVASTLGAVVGATAPMIGGEGALTRLGIQSPMLRELLSNGAYGAVAGATHSDNPLLGGIEGAAIGAGGGLAGRGVAKGLGATLEGVTNPAVGYVNREGVPLTIGQAVGQSGPIGRAVKGVEDRLSGLPLGINARRLEGLQKMNSKAFDKALEPIGGSSGGKFGEEAVANAQDQVGQAFNKALAGKTASLDRPFIVDATKAKMALNKLPDRVRDEVNNEIDQTVSGYFDPVTGNLSGENMQAMLRDLANLKKAYRNDPLGHRIGQVVDQFSDSVEGMFQRQAPDVMPQYNAAKKAFRRVSVLQDAVNAAKNVPNNGNALFTPAQLGQADRANTIKYAGKGAAAAGRGEFHDFQRAMQEVLPNKVPDSGTAGRLLIPGAIIAAGGGAGAAEGDTGKGLTLGALLALAYSKAGQRALTASVLSRPSAARAAGAVVRKSAPLLGRAGAAEAAIGSQRD